MGNLLDKVNHLDKVKEKIKKSIIEKGVEVTDEDTFMSYGDKIRDISGGSLYKYVPYMSMVRKINETYYQCVYANSNNLSCQLTSNVNGWCLATVTTRSDTNFPEGWEILKQVNIPYDSFIQRMYMLSKQVTKGEIIDFSCGQPEEKPIYINLIALECNGFETNNDTEFVAIDQNISGYTVPKTYDKCIWCCSAIFYIRGTEWVCDELKGIYDYSLDMPRHANMVDFNNYVSERYFKVCSGKTLSNSKLAIDSVKIL